MRTPDELSIIAAEIYWHHENGEMPIANEKLAQLQTEAYAAGRADGLREGAKIGARIIDLTNIPPVKKVAMMSQLAKDISALTTPNPENAR